MATTTGTNQSPQQFLESVLPGVTGLTNTATNNIGSLLSGLPSASSARTANAYFGVGAGTPAGPNGAGGVNTFIGNRGADLYGQQAQQNQQTGLNDLLSTIGTFTSPALANQGQQLSNTQFGQGLGEQQYEFDQNNTLNQFSELLKALNV